ncbi:MAG: FkbM family methyltransferase [Verrucomicrobiia bacterium]
MKHLSLLLKYGWANCFRLLALKKLWAGEVKLRLKDGHGPLVLSGNSMDYRLFSDIFLYECYNLELCSEPEYIMDCGANVGISTRYFIKRYPKARIAAVEPDQRNYSLLQSNLEKCGVITFKVALHNNRRHLRLTSDNLSSSSRRFDEAGSGSEQVVAVPLQDLFAELRWPRIDLLKIDIDGGEFALFDTQDLWLSRVNVFVMEFHEYLRKGATQVILSKIFSTGQYHV